ncbi:hypothetical protein C9374_009508 [Naegleria lovaniensis]|uniref:cysteine desulfurase n=1 Tax=Naegleria lovaniensis TaxID=51637 RepID=A0AA88KR10_NAELO|nr:uncharacterized protein C9374_009508 [Naegleria lovaniensis]KAG2392931.1 hypothetical protein C9374_009508 [Naegleria lovaniensis]
MATTTTDSSSSSSSALIYLDYNATTPIHPVVGQTMIPYITTHFGNPSSSHQYGAITKKAVTHARIQVSELLNCYPEEIIFTSGGTESNNYAIKGVVETALLKRSEMMNSRKENEEKSSSSLHAPLVHCISCKIEHPSILEVFKYLEQRYRGLVEITYCGVDSNGVINLEELKNALRKETVLVSVMHSNNEVGTLQPIKEIGGIIRNFEKTNGMQKHSILLHTDAAQSVGKILISLYDQQIFSHVDDEEKGVKIAIDRNNIKKELKELNENYVSELFGDDDEISPVHLLSVCTHKFYGPKGVGALFIRKNCGIQLQKQMHGAGVHEKGFRSGTENVIEIVGLGKACELSLVEMIARVTHMKKTRDLLHSGLLDRLQHRIFLKLNGHPEKRLPNTLNISFAGLEANTILDDISQYVAASAGAACHSTSHSEDNDESKSTKKIVISQILEEMGVSVNVGMGTIRFSTGIHLTEEQVKRAIDIIAESVLKMIPETIPTTHNTNSLQTSAINSETHLTSQNNHSNALVGSLLPLSLTTNHDATSNTEKALSPTTATPLSDIKLTSTTHGLGCGCKIRAQTLSAVLRKLPLQPMNPNVLVGTETSDDCGVYRLNAEQALCLTVDFFTPIVDSPKDFGAIACANALSDVYAMGGECRVALNIVAFPVKRLPLEILQQILEGAQMKANEAGVTIIGGHSIEDNEPKFGMCVTGVVHPDRVWKNVGSRPGDVLILTKPIGTGIITTGLKKNMITSSDESAKKCVEWMSTLNKKSSEILRGKYREEQRDVSYTIHGCTDVTGFGLLGHLKEMMTLSECGEERIYAEIESSKVPIMENVYNLVVSDVIPGGTVNNMNFVSTVTKYEDSVSSIHRTILNDAQTSGGLLFSVPPHEVEEIRKDFMNQGVEMWIIGCVKAHQDTQSSYSIRVV